MEATLRPRRAIVPTSVLGMLIFIVAEVMFFAGFISAFTIVRANVPAGLWPPPGQPRLPAGATLLNTAVLLASGVVLAVALRRFRAGGTDRWSSRSVSSSASNLTLAAVALGVLFVALQGFEWIRMLGQGLTLTSSPLGSFFYVIVGTHGLHALGAIVALLIAAIRSRRGTLTPGYFFATSAFWYFVVAMWPIIYVRVYLA